MILEELIYNAWANPQATDIEEDVVGIIETTEEFSSDVVDKIINRIYNVSDVYRADSVDWLERVIDIIKKFVDEE